MQEKKGKKRVKQEFFSIVTNLGLNCSYVGKEGEETDVQQELSQCCHQFGSQLQLCRKKTKSTFSQTRFSLHSNLVCFTRKIQFRNSVINMLFSDVQPNQSTALQCAKIASDIATAVFKKPPMTIEKLISLTTVNESRREQLRKQVAKNRLKRTVHLTTTLTMRPIESPYQEFYQVLNKLKEPEMPLRRLPLRKAKVNHSILSCYFQQLDSKYNANVSYFNENSKTD